MPLRKPAWTSACVLFLFSAILASPSGALAQENPPQKSPPAEQAADGSADRELEPRASKKDAQQTGPVNTDLPSARYPPRATSPYLLPWPVGVTYLCAQGNRGVVSHKGAGQYAYDFAMPVGSDVCAARAGVVTKIVVRHTGQGTSAPNNLIAIDHGDGTTGYYLHLKKGGSYVVVGETVHRGQRIAASGNVGRSLIPHLHFHVKGRAGKTIPITFRDVAIDLGIPRMFRHYTSGNSPEKNDAEKD